ncbi:MAG: hypothetical protein JNL70_20615 [Saprospiraceae bacterium]|nr:hypothetical protein [Saprospiraceae bacterium]
MKQIFFILIALSFSVDAFTQPNGDRIKNRVEARRIGFITQRLNLSPEESQQFWPIYNQYTEKMKQIRTSVKLDKPLEDMSDADAEKLIMSEMDKQSRELELRKEYYQKLKKVISPKKIAKLYKAERDFKAEMLKQLHEIKQMKQNRQGQMPNRQGNPLPNKN